MPPFEPVPTAAYQVPPWSSRAATLYAAAGRPWSWGVQVAPASTERKKPSVSPPAMTVPVGDCARTLMNPPPSTAELVKESPEALAVSGLSGAAAKASTAPVSETVSR